MASLTFGSTRPGLDVLVAEDSSASLSVLCAQASR